MQRIRGANATVDHKFQAGNPLTGQQATSFTSEWANSLQEELAAVREAAGIDENLADDTQLLQAMQKLFGKGQTLQIVFTEDDTPLFVDAAIPLDNSVPENTEGVEYTQLQTTFTPKRADSKLKITLSVPTMDIRGSQARSAVALFRDAQQYAFRAANIGDNDRVDSLTLVAITDAVSTAETVIKVRFGARNSWINRTRNGAATSGVYGSSDKSLLIVEEISP